MIGSRTLSSYTIRQLSPHHPTPPFAAEAYAMWLAMASHPQCMLRTASPKLTQPPVSLRRWSVHAVLAPLLARF